MSHHDPDRVGPNDAIACRLTPDEYPARREAWEQVIARALRRHMEPGRITVVYPYEDDLLDRLTALIEAERSCCPFLRFTVHEGDDEVRVDLEHPPGFEPELGQFLPA